MIKKILETLEVGQFVTWNRDPRSRVSDYHKLTMRRFKVSKTFKGDFQIERTK